VERRRQRLTRRASVGVLLVAALLTLAGMIPTAAAAGDTDPCRYLTKQMRLEIFMTIMATDADIAGVRTYLDTSPLIRRYQYLDQDASYAQFRRIFADDPDFVANVDPDALPTSFRVVPRRKTTTGLIASEAGALSGVDDVTNPGVSLRRICRASYQPPARPD